MGTVPLAEASRRGAGRERDGEDEGRPEPPPGGSKRERSGVVATGPGPAVQAAHEAYRSMIRSIARRHT